MVVVNRRSNNQWRVVSGAPVNVVAPGAPSGVSATSPTAGVLRVFWTAPSDTGNGDVTNYDIQAYNGVTLAATTTANPLDTDTLVTGLTAGVAYTCKVIAHTAAGPGPASTASAPATVTTATTYTLPNGNIIPSGWDSPVTTGVIGGGYQYGQLTPFTGSLVTTADNQVIQGYDIRGNIAIRHNNVIIRHCRVHSIQTSTTLVGGESIIDGNQSTIVGGNRIWLANNLLVEYCDVIGSLNPNLNDQSGITSGGATGLTARYNVIHDASDALTPGDQSSCTHNVVYDMKVANGSHADCYQITEGANALVQDNVFLGLMPSGVPVLGGDGVWRLPKTDGYANSAIQIGAQTDVLTNLTINHNYMSGGIYTINSNNTNEGTYGAITGAYTNNVFSGYFHYGPVANIGSGMTFDDSNIWEATRETNAWAGAGDSIEKYWHITGGTKVNGTPANTTI